MVASFDTFGDLLLEVINVSLDGKQFRLPENTYNDFCINIEIDFSLKRLSGLIKFRTEISTEKLVTLIRCYVWNKVIDRGINLRTMGWSALNTDYMRFPERAREIRQIQLDTKMIDLVGFMEYRSRDVGKDLMLTALRFGEFIELDTLKALKQYLGNPAQDNDTAIKMYNNTQDIITTVYQIESQRRMDILRLRAQYGIKSKPIDPPID